MQGTRFTSGAMILVALLAFFAIFFADVPLAYAAGSLSFFLVIQAISFSGNLAAVAESVEIERTTSTTYIRQGTNVMVNTRITVEKPPSIQCHLRDIIPEGFLLIRGTSDGEITNSATACTMRYVMRSQIGGQVKHGGIELEVLNLFFAQCIILDDDRARSPTFTIYPVRQSERKEMETSREDEKDRVTLFPGYGVRSYREYVAGDDLRHIDWKITAKHQKLFVREYSGRERGENLIVIVDLPDAASPVNTDALWRMKDAVARTVTAEIRKSGKCSLMLISGADIIRFLPAERDIGKMLSATQEINPYYTNWPLYRVKNSATLLNLSKKMEKQADEVYASNLAKIFAIFAQDKPSPIFEKRLARAFRTLSSSKILLFSLVQTDSSNLRMIGNEGRRMLIHVHLTVPKESYTPAVQQKIRNCSFSSIEVLK